jgi:putative hydrolase of the HAD superfamily
MERSGTIKGILFDVGDTLVKPTSGHWFMSPNFAAILDAHSVELPDRRELYAALGRGGEYLDANHSVQTVEEEFDQFVVFYSLVSDYLGLKLEGKDLFRELAYDMVYNNSKFELFDDTEEQIKRFYRRGFRLGIVSDTWPSLERVFTHFGLHEFFITFTISSRIGCLKPDERMFRHSIEALDLLPESILFVDNAQINVRKANEMGMFGVLIDRYGECDRSNLPCIRDLKQLDAYL